MGTTKLSHLAETLQASEIVRLGATIKEKIKQGERIYNYTIGDFDSSVFPIPAELEKEIIDAYKNNFTKQYQQQLLQLNQKLKQSKVAEKQLQSQLIIVEALIEANKKLLVTGDALITEYVLALGNLISIKNAISQNQINTLQLINEINYWKLNE